MKRRGNMLIMTLVTCALLAVILVGGLEVASLKKATMVNQVASLKLEQLHRTALNEGMEILNAHGEPLTTGHTILSETPVKGQTHKLSVTEVQPRQVILSSEARLSDGSARFHQVALLVLPKEARLNFKQLRRALFFGGMEKDVSTQWLYNHKEEDIVCLCDNGLTVGEGGVMKTPLQGSLLLTGWEEDHVAATIETKMQIKGHVVATGNLALRADLSCENAWIDGTLTIDEGVILEAKKVYLTKDVPLEVLRHIKGTVFMPHPESIERDVLEEGATFELKPLPEDANPATDRKLYIMLQQLN